MAFTVEDGTGIAGANAYCTVAYVSTYHSDRNNTSWASASTASQQAAILDATRYLDTFYSFPWGTRVSSTQGLLWPRKGALDYEGFAIDGIPTVLKDAVAELSLQALTTDLLAPQDRETASETVGPVSVTYRPGAAGQKTFPTVTRMLVRYGLIAGGGSVRVVRA